MHDWPKQNVDNDDASLFFLPYPPLLFNPKTLHFHPHKQLEQLADLAVVNERLAGGSGSQARARVDFLRGRRRLWARVYDVVTRSNRLRPWEAVQASSWALVS